MDMLHLDIHWRGHNVACDPGTFRYNASDELHEHFTGTASHSTLTVDGMDQMVRIRKFKMLYPTIAKLEAFEVHDDHVVCVGTHSGYQRLPGSPLHRRAVLFLKSELWVVIDTVLGSGSHDVRLHWLLGDFPHVPVPAATSCTLLTPSGEFSVRVWDVAGAPCALDIAVGAEHPPRGWLSRRYGARQPVPSVAVSAREELPLMFVSTLGPDCRVARVGDDWSVESSLGSVSFRCDAGVPTHIRLKTTATS